MFAKKFNAMLLTGTIMLGMLNAVFADVTYSSRNVYTNVSGDFTSSNVYCYSNEDKQNKKHTVVFVADSRTAKVDNDSITIDEPPYIENGITMLPLRAVTEMLGTFENNISISWNSATGKAVVIYGDRQLIFTADKNIYTLNGNEIEMTAGTAKIKNGRVYIPLRELANAMDLSISWDDISKEVTISN